MYWHTIPYSVPSHLANFLEFGTVNTVSILLFLSFSKVEDAFYGSRLRLNGLKLIKKSKAVGDPLDFHAIVNGIGVHWSYFIMAALFKPMLAVKINE